MSARGLYPGIHILIIIVCQTLQTNDRLFLHRAQVKICLPPGTCPRSKL